jgi:hypothetical protein
VENGRAGRSVSSKRYVKLAPGEARSPRALPTFPTIRPGSASTCPEGFAVSSSSSQPSARRGTLRASAPAPAAPSDRIDLFAPPSADDPEAADPVALARAATQASGRAMRARLWTEARALAGLAESYARLGERARGGGQTIETMDLGLLYAVLTDDSGAAAARMALGPDRQNDPDRALKEAWHRRCGERSQAMKHHQLAMLFRIHAAEARIRAMGGAVEVSQSSFDETADARAWLLETASELDDVTVTPSPPPGDPWAVGR